MADRSNRRYGDTLTHSSLVVSQTNASLDNTNVHQLRLHLHIVKLDVFTLRHKMTKISSDQTPTQGDQKNIIRLVSRHLTSLHLTSSESFDSSTMNNDDLIHAQAAFILFTSLCKSIHSRHHFNHDFTSSSDLIVENTRCF